MSKSRRPSPPRPSVSLGSRISSAVVAACALGLAVGVVQGLTAGSAPPPGDLRFFKNYFVTGDYVAGGIGLRGQGVGGLATGEIAISGVPAGADVIAAFLYWQVVANDAGGPDTGSLTATFRGRPLRSADGPFGKPLGPGTGACAVPTADKTAGPFLTWSYRADVLRFFGVDEQTGKLAVNGAHQVQIPDGDGALALGASLVVVYRDSSAPLSAIVLYDGGLYAGTGPMTRRIEGFYDAASQPSAKLTVIAGGGGHKGERLLVNDVLVATNPFASSLGASWDTTTVELSATNVPGLPEATSITTSVVGDENGKYDCLTYSAIAYRTTVQDSDGDGLLDAWESASTPLVDPTGQALPNLPAMGADPHVKDLFVEMAYMYAAADAEGNLPAYGGVQKPEHSHLPGHEALKLLGDAFRDAPTGRINVHFDLGEGYPSGPADEYIIRGPGLARGGEAIDERATTSCTRGAADPPWVCQYSEYPGTVGWKTGFQFLRDEVLAGPPAPPGGDDPCDAPGSACVRRFDRERKDIFRFVLFAHAIGLPKSEQPCLDETDTPVPAVAGACTAPLRSNPDFHVPRTNTGVGDFPGGDAMVTLGAFDDEAGLPIGMPYAQAATLMHELGHGMERRHGGEAFEPNCKPTYFSVMNYLYQLRGLLDDDGRPHLGFSSQLFSSVDENSLADGSLGWLPFRTGWYAPLAGSYLEGRATPARRHCNGSELTAADVPSVRIDARTALGPVDWNANGLAESGFALDVNYNGRATDELRSSDDWSNLVVNQVGARRNTGALYIADATGRLEVGALSLDTGRGDLGRGDLGRGDLGRGDLGRGDLGRGDLGRGDLGRGDLGRGDLGTLALGRGDLGRGDLGGGDLFVGDPDNPSGELDFETASDLARTPPTEFRACVVDAASCTAEGAAVHQVRLDWRVPNVGGVERYLVYRVAGEGLLPMQEWQPVGLPVDANAGQLDYTQVDAAPLVDGAAYTYFSVAEHADGVRSDPSNLVTITAVNDAPSLSDIADVEIDAGTSTGPIAFTVADEDPASVTITATSSDGTLVPATAIVLAGAGTERTITVTPAPGESGSAIITVTATDAAGASASDAFVLTVKRGTVAFVGVLNAPPPWWRIFRAGRVIPIYWKFGSYKAPVDSASVSHEVTVRGPLPKGPIRTFTNTAPGQCDFRYDARSRTWKFNLQTRDEKGRPFPAGTYEVVVRPLTPGFESGGPFVIRLAGGGFGDDKDDDDGDDGDK